MAGCLSGRSKVQCQTRYAKKVSETEEGVWDEDDERKLFMSVVTHVKEPKFGGNHILSSISPTPGNHPKYPRLAYCNEVDTYMDIGKSGRKNNGGEDTQGDEQEVVDTREGGGMEGNEEKEEVGGEAGQSNNTTGKNIRKKTHERCDWKRISRLVPGRNDFQVVSPNKFLSNLC